jgi:hypothetical protein
LNFVKIEDEDQSASSVGDDGKMLIKLELVNLVFNIYMLRWNKNVIYGDYRNYIKKLNQLNYKNKYFDVSLFGRYFFIKMSSKKLIGK